MLSPKQPSSPAKVRNLDYAFPPFALGLPSVYERAGFDVNRPRSRSSSRASSITGSLPGSMTMTGSMTNLSSLNHKNGSASSLKSGFSKGSSLKPSSQNASSVGLSNQSSSLSLQDMVTNSSTPSLKTRGQDQPQTTGPQNHSRYMDEESIQTGDAEKDKWPGGTSPYENGPPVPPLHSHRRQPSGAQGDPVEIDHQEVPLRSDARLANALPLPGAGAGSSPAAHSNSQHNNLPRNDGPLEYELTEAPDAVKPKSGFKINNSGDDERYTKSRASPVQQSSQDFDRPQYSDISGLSIHEPSDITAASTDDAHRPLPPQHHIRRPSQPARDPMSASDTSRYSEDEREADRDSLTSDLSAELSAVPPLKTQSMAMPPSVQLPHDKARHEWEPREGSKVPTEREMSAKSESTEAFLTPQQSLEDVRGPEVEAANEMSPGKHHNEQLNMPQPPIVAKNIDESVTQQVTPQQGTLPSGQFPGDQLTPQQQTMLPPDGMSPLFNQAPHHHHGQAPLTMGPSSQEPTSQGLPHQGAPHQGISPRAMPPQGMPPQGMPPQGRPPQEMPPQGIPPQGMPPQGIPPQGMPPQGMPPYGMPPQGRLPQGMSPQGMSAQGMPPQGRPPQGMSPQGMSPQGMPPQGMQMPPIQQPRGPSQQIIGHDIPPRQRFPPNGGMPPRPPMQGGPNRMIPPSPQGMPSHGMMPPQGMMPPHGMMPLPGLMPPQGFMQPHGMAPPMGASPNGMRRPGQPPMAENADVFMQAKPRFPKQGGSSPHLAAEGLTSASSPSRYNNPGMPVIQKQKATSAAHFQDPLQSPSAFAPRQQMRPPMNGMHPGMHPHMPVHPGMVPMGQTPMGQMPPMQMPQMMGPMSPRRDPNMAPNMAPNGPQMWVGPHSGEQKNKDSPTSPSNTRADIPLLNNQPETASNEAFTSSNNGTSSENLLAPSGNPNLLSVNDRRLSSSSSIYSSRMSKMPAAVTAHKSHIAAPELVSLANDTMLTQDTSVGDDFKVQGVHSSEPSQGSSMSFDFNQPPLEVSAPPRSNTWYSAEEEQTPESEAMLQQEQLSIEHNTANGAADDDITPTLNQNGFEKVRGDGLTGETPGATRVSSNESKGSTRADSRAPSTGKQPKVCRGCSQTIVGKSVRAKDGTLSGRWHKSCLNCSDCSSSLAGVDKIHVLDDQPFCARCYHIANNTTCAMCNEGIEGQSLETRLSSNDGQPFLYHINCLRCASCQIKLHQSYFDVGGVPYCAEHAFSSLPDDKTVHKRYTQYMMI